jgi:hypothetical protein
MAEVVKVFDTLPLAPVADAVAAISQGAPWKKCAPVSCRTARRDT